ncbi:MAG: helix-turn-helix domain-containing protein [Anaerovoracaceae bacterium]|nr:helix-turn-helix transcriptional regulator [Anaerovoracaceae bacterium]
MGILIGQRLKKLRIDAHLTQEKVAQTLNVSREAYSLYETNKRQMNYDTICALSTMYDVSADYLLGLSDSKKSYDLDSDEAILLNLYRTTDSRGRKIILETAKIAGP